MINEASQIMQSQQSTSKVYSRKRAPKGKSKISKRRNVKGWQFKTGDFKGEKDVSESINNYLQQEDQKQIVRSQLLQQAQQMDDFALCIKQDRISKVSGEEGLRDAIVIDAIYESIRNGGERVSIER